jgi:hypothetical protein
MSDANVQVDLIQLDGKLERMMQLQTCMADDISKIKEAVYNPDEGLYARLRELESWKETQSRLMWILITSVVGLITASCFSFLASV